MAKRATLEGRDLLFHPEEEKVSDEPVVNKSTPRTAENADQENKNSRKEEPLEKVSFRLSPSLITRLARAKVDLREWGIKANKEQIVAQALERILDDLEENQEKSHLVASFSRSK